MKLSVIKTGMIENFQCPGCTCGHTTQSCGSYKPVDEGEWGFSCDCHSAGTLALGIGHINLGLPKGFNRVVYTDGMMGDGKRTNIRLFDHQVFGVYDKLNVPVWAMEKDGYLYVRCYLPRTDRKFVDVHKGGKLEELRKKFTEVIDVAEFITEID
jgi:hypothetical protein